MTKEKPNIMDSKKRYFSLLILVFPVLLMALIPSEISGSVIYPIIMKVLIVGYQIIIVNNFLDNLYGE